MLYRLFTSEDFDDLYSIEEACFEPPFRFGRQYMRQLTGLPNTATWIADDNGRIAGFAIVEWTREIGGLVAYIQTIEVDLAHRGRGVGSELLRRTEGSAHAEGAVAIWLHVDAGNASAIRLYQAHGFQSEGRTENYYGKGRAAEIYVKQM